jgi:dTDP-4-dehydrorhamnose reductase
MDRTVVLGGSGFVGGEIVRYFGCPATSYGHREGFERVDATRPEELRAFLLRLKPELLINCVGLADVDRAEREPHLADLLNHRVVENLVRLQAEVPFRLVHISTDGVFDGSRGMYREEDSVGPINEYGRSKLRGEQALAGTQAALILRISSPFGRSFEARKTQFFRYVVETLRAGKPVRAVTDQRVTATFLSDLAVAIETLTRRFVEGVVHIGSEEPLTRFEFAQKIAKVVDADSRLVTKAYRSDMTQWIAPRPADTSLAVAKSRQLGVTYTPVERALRTLLAE